MASNKRNRCLQQSRTRLSLSILNDNSDVVAKVAYFECNAQVNICKVFSPGHSKRWWFSNYY